ncbi:leucine--tRNA ligase [Candidatus Bathyarchaeota archaeon]|nr:leucine--tRNA ligase [Candidatus Bathyarchaeota archaeon]
MRGSKPILDWRGIERKWLKAWEESRIFEADPDPGKRKFFITVAYPYPNSPQHIGHGRTYTITDVYARYLRMRGYNVLFPMAFHYTGTPILAMSKRLRAGDKELEETFLKIYRVPREIMEGFHEPLNIARYFHREIKDGMREMGYSIDWRREFTTIDPQYSRFIEWQFHKLKEKGLISRGSHPVGWCPSCGSPVGQHDTIGDKEPEIGEFTLIKFRFNGKILPTATLRPETVFGVTNIWVNPEAVYVEAQVDGEEWILTDRGAEKLKYLGRSVSVKGSFQGSRLIGGYAENPVTGLRIPILPASFVDPGNATGVVMSVPAHAPFDYQALKDLRDKGAELLERYGVLPSILDGLKPIPVIEVEGFSEVPARDVVERMGVKDQDDPRLVDATEEVYSKEYHLGFMRRDIPSYSGLPVSKAKEMVKDDLLREGSGDRIYEIINRPVLCRCGGECLVKIFEDQWFINYGDESWKEMARACLEGMRIIPEEVRVEFEHTIGWLKGKACARSEGLGTPLPWDKEWIIESLSDSVIYMAYYTIAHHLRRVPAEKLTPQVFDYILLGEGDPGEISDRTGMDAGFLLEMRREFTYFYPLDSRHSGRDLIPNHLTFFIFNHAAIFPREHWPRSIVVNGSVLMEGKKMSKSFGNIIPLREAVREFAVDPLRLSLVATAGLLQDVDFSPALARSMRERLERLYSWALNVLAGPSEPEGDWGLPERWLWSRINRIIRDATLAMEELRFRDALQLILYLLDQEMGKYVRLASIRGGDGVNPGLLRRILDLRVRLLAPFAPFLCEEIWSLLGDGLVSRAEWPEADLKALDEGVEEAVAILDRVLDDAKDLCRILKGKPLKIRLYSASKAKLEAYRLILEGASMGEALKAVAAGGVGEVDKLARTVKGWVTDAARTPEPVKARRRAFLESFNEYELLREFSKYLEGELSLPVEVYSEDDPEKVDPAGRAARAEPLKPAIHIEVERPG